MDVTIGAVVVAPYDGYAVVVVVVVAAVKGEWEAVEDLVDLLNSKDASVGCRNFPASRSVRYLDPTS